MENSSSYWTLTNLICIQFLINLLISLFWLLLFSEKNSFEVLKTEGEIYRQKNNDILELWIKVIGCFLPIFDQLPTSEFPKILNIERKNYSHGETEE